MASITMFSTVFETWEKRYGSFRSKEVLSILYILYAVYTVGVFEDDVNGTL